MRAPQRSVRTRPCPRSIAWQASSSARGSRRGLEQHHLVEVGRLVHPAERRRLLDGRRADQPRVREARPARRAPPRRCAGAIAQVAAQRHVRALGRRGHAQASTAKCRAIRWRSAATSPSSRMARSSSACPAAASAGAAGQGVGLGPGAGRAGGDPLDLAGEAVDRVELLGRRRRDGLARGGPPRRWCRRWRRAPARRRRSAPPRRPRPPARAPSGRETAATWPAISSSSARASPAACRLCAARSRTSSATTAKPRPSGPARAASIAALRAIRLVRSAISRMVPMKPVIRWVMRAEGSRPGRRWRRRSP